MKQVNANVEEINGIVSLKYKKTSQMKSFIPVITRTRTLGFLFSHLVLVRLAKRLKDRDAGLQVSFGKHFLS